MDESINLGEYEGLSSSEACYYQVMGCDIDMALYTVSETMPVLGCTSTPRQTISPAPSSDSNNKYVNKKSAVTRAQPELALDQQPVVCDVYDTEEMPDAGQTFSATEQMLYQATREERDAALYEVRAPPVVASVDRPGSPGGSDDSKGKTRTRNRERRKRQRTRRKSQRNGDQETEKDRKSPVVLLSQKPLKPDKKSPDKQQHKKPSPKVDIKSAKKGTQQHEKGGSKSPEEKGKKTPPPLKGAKSGKSTPASASSDKGHTPRLAGKSEVKSTPGSESKEKISEKVSLLEKDFIYPLKKKSLKFPRAKFFCRLCDYHCDDTGHAYRHIKENRHQAAKNSRVRDLMLGCLPPPTDIHTEAVTELLTQVVKSHLLTEQDITNRQEVVQQLRAILSDKYPDASLRLYGSSVNGFGLQCSDVNIELKADKAPMALKDLFILLKQSTEDYFTEVKSDFSATVPCVLCQVPQFSLHVKIGVTSAGVTLSSSYLTSQLLRAYCSIDPRVSQLGVPFRLWAKLCGIDDQESGTLPAYVFGLMTVFFLQHCDPPVLPVLHEVGQPLDRNAGAPDNTYFNDIKNLHKFWKCENTDSAGALWIKMCEFYALKMDMREIIVCIRSTELINKGEKKWTKRLAIEDPFQRKRNISRSISHSQVFDYIYDQLRNLYQYFGIPQTKQGPVFKDVDHMKFEDQLVQMFRDASPRKHSPGPQTPGPQTPATPNKTPVDDKTESGRSSSVVKSSSQDLIGESDEEDEGDHRKGTDVYTFAAGLVKDALAQGINQSVHSDGTQASPALAECLFDKALLLNLTAEDLSFVFAKDVLCDRKNPPLICALCHKHGHLQQNCPDVQLPVLTTLPPLTRKYRSMLDNIIKKVPQDFEPTTVETNLRDQLCEQLEFYIRMKYPDAKLSLFGSSCNGFGFSHSDMDICMVLEKTESEKVDYVQVIKTLSRHLMKHHMLTGVFAITTAKVPIVKFKHKQSGLEGDISLYNTLAVHNTSMLMMYSSMDYRVRALGYTMKVFAKLCDICDASKGSLSSYAYILMVIYFLQQRNPPVLPVLQELHTGEKPEVIVDGWNAWFYADMDKLSSVWSDHCKNTETLGELWIGMLRFYTEEFNFKDYVISIRQKTLLTRFEKLWNGKCVAIEDPFDLGHNLGGGLSRKMDAYIMKAFHNGRMLFGTSVNTVPNGYMTLEDYLFDPKLLTDTAPPTDRNCRICKKIGHWARQCPQNRDKNDDQKENNSGNNTHNQQQQQKKKSNTPTNTNKTPAKGSSNDTVSSNRDVTETNRGSAKKGGKQPESRPSNAYSSAGQHSAESHRSGKDHSQHKGGKRTLSEPDRVANKHTGHKNRDLGGGDTGQSNLNKQSTHNRVNGSAQRNQHQQQQQQQQHQQHHRPRVFYNKHRASEPVNMSPRQSQVHGHVNHQSPVQPLMSMNPVQQLFNNYGSPQQQHMPPMPPMPLMAVQVGPPGHQQVTQPNVTPLMAVQVTPPRHQQHAPLPRDRTVELSPPTNYGVSGGLTWQQQQLQQHLPVSRRRNRKSQGSGEEYEAEYPSLEVTIHNEQLTWQQQHLTGSPKKKRKNPQQHSSPRH